MIEKIFDIRAYELFLSKLAKENSSDIINNGGKDYAVALYAELLRNTHKEVRIFCQSGASEVWTDEKFTTAMKYFLSLKGTSLKVLTANEPALSKEWTDKENVEAFHITQEEKEKINKHFRNQNCNFATFDTIRYRYEFNIDEFKAYGCFNAPETTSQMISLFDDAFDKARG